MASPYANPTIVRQLATAITTDVIDDTGINAISTSQIDPLIDACLKGLGSPWTGTTPGPVEVAASYLVVSVIFDDRYYQTADESDWGRKKWDKGMAILNGIKDGTYRHSDISSPALLQVTDPEADRAKTEVFAGTDLELDWQGREEDRAT